MAKPKRHFDRTFADIQMLALTNEVVHAFMTFYLRNKISKEECLCGCIIALAEQNKRLIEDLIKAESMLLPRMVITCPPG